MSKEVSLEEKLGGSLGWEVLDGMQKRMTDKGRFMREIIDISV